MVWLKDGDVNSRVFHRASAARRIQNGFSGLEVGGEWVEDPSRIEEEIYNHFQLHFQQRHSPKLRLREDFFAEGLGEAEREQLVRPFTEEEVKAAVWDCDSSKSPGPDGFNFAFLKDCWGIVKKDVLRVVMKFHQFGRIARGCTLILSSLSRKRRALRRLTNSGRFPSSDVCIRSLPSFFRAALDRSWER
ncbi:hypothetical protein OROHE_009796 [Orobanche hederae]